MTLRSRLLLTGLLVAVPLALAWFVLDTRMRLASKEEELRLSVAADLAAGLQDRCEADPPREGRPGRGGGPPRQGRGPGGPGPGPGPGPGQGPGAGAPQGPPPRPNPGAPPGPRRDGAPRGPGQRAGGTFEYFAYDETGRPSAPDAPPLPADRDGSAGTTYWTTSGLGVALVVPLASSGRCAFLLARIPPRPNDLRDQARALLVVIVSVLAAAWIAAGPVISRMRRLASAVRSSAAARYETPVVVEGRDEVAALGTAFNDAARQIREHVLEVQHREETLRDFVANTTHDVAIPLSVLQGHLAELDGELTDPAARERVRAAIREAHYMGSLLRNLAAATKLDEHGARLAILPVDLSTILEHVVARHRPIARASGVDLNVAVPGTPVTATTDSTLLEQALSNLVDNAIRYNASGGHVAVLLDHDGDGYAISVIDDGPGVTDEELASLTTRWFRGSTARTRRPDGKGLGLAIANESLVRLGLTLTFVRPADGGLRADIRGFTLA